MRLLSAVAAALLVSACVSIDTTNKSRLASTVKEVVSAPPLTQQRTVKLGETMIAVRNYTATTVTTDVMEVSEDFRLTGFEDRDFRKGEKLAIVGERKIKDTVYTIARPSNWFVALQISPDGSLTPSLINTDIEMVWKVTADPPTVRFKRVPLSATSTNGEGLNYDLAYNGLDGQSMKFQYREFKANDLDRPTITQDFAFPVGSPKIDFKGISVDVMTATPTEISFSIRSLMSSVPTSTTMQSPAPN